MAIVASASVAKSAHGTQRPEATVRRSGKSAWTQVTRASWYGQRFKGRRTATGRRFDPHGLTAAHRSLRFGSRVRVTELCSGRSVVVEITDRGPYIRGRGIDLSYGAARELGIVNRGVTRVHLELMNPENEVALSDATGVETALASGAGEWAPVSLVE